jgi:predicted GTPase
MRRVLIMGAGGRDFHNFNVAFRDDTDSRVVAFTATQIPGIDNRVYPASLAGPLYPEGILIRPERELEAIIVRENVDEVVLAYSDISHEAVMHQASRVLAKGADFRLLGPDATMLHSSRPLIAVCAVRTGCGKSQTSRYIGKYLIDHGLRVALVRHPMPYGDLEAMRVQRFATIGDIDASNPTIEEREEYEAPVELGMVMYAGVDYGDILRNAEQEADVIIWDGGNNDFPFYSPAVMVTVADPLRVGHELTYHPGETNVRLADVVVVNKVDSASPEDVNRLIADIRTINGRAKIVQAESPVTLADGPDLAGLRALVIDDGPTLTHGGMSFGAGAVAARRNGVAELVDPRPYAVGSIADTFARFPQLGTVLPAMGYGEAQLRELEQTINATPCDVVITGTPIDLGRVISANKPIRHARYELRPIGKPSLEDVFDPIIGAFHAMRESSVLTALS